ncbi:MAG: PAS domain S-box protein [Desulfobacteraceae bacterium]|nr:PAS domain S-box protein [Desulfobacteraceae bacterium]
MTISGQRFFKRFTASIRNRLLIAFVSLVVLSSAVITFSSIVVGMKNGREHALEQFSGVAALKAAQLRIWLRSLQTDLLALANEQHYRQLALALTVSAEPLQLQQESRSLLERFLQVKALSNRFEELFLITATGNVIVSTDPVKVGEHRSLQSYFKGGLKQAGVYIQSISFSSASEKLNNVIAVHPVKDNIGRSAGVICGQANLGMVNNIMGQRSGLGHTGETYLVGKNHVLMTITRFAGYTPNMTAIYAPGIVESFKQRADVQGLYTDYRDVPVIGIYHWIPELELVLASEQDRSEAFAPIYYALKHNISAALFAVFLSAAAALMFTRSISRPVANLSLTADRIAKGNLSLRAASRGPEEIASLALSFNAMTANLADRLETERWIARLSRRFIGLPVAGTGPAIEQALDQLGQFRQVDHCYVVLFSPDGASITDIHRWRRSGVPASDEVFRQLPLNDYPWFAGMIQKGEVVRIDSITDLPPEAESDSLLWSRAAFRSFLCVPKVYDQSLKGFVGFDTVIKQRTWSDEEVHLLSQIGEIVFNALAKQRTENYLRESEKRFRTVVNASQDAMIVLNCAGAITLFNPAAEKIFLSTQDAMQGRAVSGLFPGEHRKLLSCYLEDFKSAKAAPSSGQTIELQAKRGDNSLFPAELSLSTGRLGGEPFFLAVLRDITERKNSEENMRRLQNLLHNIINSMPSVLVGVDEDCKVTQWNRQAEDFTGIAAAMAHGRRLEQVLPQLSLEMDNVREAIVQNQVKKNTKVSLHFNEKRGIADITIYPLAGDSGRGAVIRVDDVTENVYMEELMIQSEKMMSIGGLAAGMAHEINNPLAGIMQSVQVVNQRLTQNLPANLRVAEACGVTLEALSDYMNKRKIPDLMNSIRTSGQRAAKIVSNMLSFARKSDSCFEDHNLAELVDNTVELASSDYDLKKKHDFRQIRIERDYDPELPKVPCEGTKIQQVIFNLLKNAAEAMAVTPGSVIEPCIRLRISSQAAMACIQVEDNGPGMEEAVRKRVFEPFFTTKSLDKGTGLGLSVSYFIICENHGGKMTVEPAPNRGTRFIIHLPMKRPQKGHNDSSAGHKNLGVDM